MGLRKGQKELVEQYRGGYCAIPAIPGGGKTYSLTQWAVEMISKGLHRPGKILIATYMNRARSVWNRSRGCPWQTSNPLRASSTLTRLPIATNWSSWHVIGGFRGLNGGRRRPRSESGRHLAKAALTLGI